MATFKKADEIAVPQSVGHYTAGDVNTSHILGVFQPHQGRDLIYFNPKFNEGSTEIQEELDKRISLGTYTLNNRDYWENNNFNESTLQPYLTEEYDYRESYKLKIWSSRLENTLDGDIVLPTVGAGDVIGAGSGDYDESNTGKFSIEVLPFVVNPNNDDIIHLDRYYDKQINLTEYELATEGKINLKFEPKQYGRVLPENPPAGANTYGESQYLQNFGMNIDIFSKRDGVGDYFDNTIRRPGITSISGSNDGCHLFKLNWDDGTELEHTSEPKLLENTVLFEHFYEKPGFYSITGVIYRVKDGKIKTWEKFQTNILLNPSPNYELNLHDYSNFASIGGIDKNSTFVKSLYNMVGINPLPPYSSAGASEEVIEELNTLDKIQILNVLGKVNYTSIQPYHNFLSPYQTPNDDSDSYVFGCTDDTSGNVELDANGNLVTDINGNLPRDNLNLREGEEGYDTGYMATHYNPDATVDDGTCIYTYNVTLDAYPSSVVLDAEEYDLDLDTPVEPYVNLTLWDSAGDGWFGMSGQYNNASLTINGVNYTLGQNVYEQTIQVQLDGGTYDWLYEVPWYLDNNVRKYVSYQDYENSWQVSLPDSYDTILLEGNGADQTNGTVAGTFVVPDQETEVTEYSFIMPTPRIDDSSIINPSIINAQQDIEISLNYLESIAPFETSGNPNEIDYKFRGWFDGSLVNQSNAYSIEGIDSIFQNETITNFNVDENIHLIAIYEYDDTRPPPPVSSVELILGNGIDFPLESINVRYMPPEELPVPMDIVSFEIVRSYSTWSHGNSTRHSEIIHTQDFQINHANEAYNHLDVGLDPLIEYTYSVFAVDDVGNRSTEVSSTETPIADIPPATPAVEGLINQESVDGYKYVEFTWTVLDPNDSASDIQGIVADGTSTSFPLVGDFSHYVVRRTQIGPPGGALDGDVVLYPLITSYAEGPRPHDDINIGIFTDATVEYDGPSYIYQVASVDINDHQSPYSLEMEILPSLTADIGFIDSATWMEGILSVRPPGIRLIWPRVYYASTPPDAFGVSFSEEFNPYLNEHQDGGNYIGFEIQKKANGEWTRNGVTIEPDTWQTIGPFYKSDVDWGEVDEDYGAAGSDGAEWELPHINYQVSGLLFLFPELGPYEDKYPNLPVYPERASNKMSSFSSEFYGHSNDSVQYADLDSTDQDNNTFYDDGWEEKWGTLVPGLEYQYRIRNISTDIMDVDLPIYFGNWAESPTVLIQESAHEDFGGEDTTAPIIEYQANSTLQSAIPSLTNEYAVDLTIRVGPPNGAFGLYDYDYFKIAVRLPAGSLGGNDAVYHNGDDYTTEESYIEISSPPNDELVEGQLLTYQITNLTQTTHPHMFILQIVDTSGNESDASQGGSHTNSNNYIYPPAAIPEFPSGTPPANPSWEAGTIWVDDDGNTWQYVWFTWAQVGGIGDGLTTPPQYGWLFISFGGG